MKIQKQGLMKVIEKFLSDELWIGDLIIERYREDIIVIVRTHDGKEWKETRIEVENDRIFNNNRTAI